MQHDGAHSRWDECGAAHTPGWPSTREADTPVSGPAEVPAALLLHGAIVVMRWRGTPGERVVDAVSDSVRRFGYAPAELCAGQPGWSAIMHPDDLPRLAGEAPDGTDAGITLAYRVITRAGAVRWVEEQVVIVADAQGRPAHAESLLLDISDRKAREEASAAREAQLRFMVDNTLDVLYTLDTRTGIITFVSPAVTRWNVSPDEVIGKPFADFVHPDDLDGVLRALQRTLATGEEFLCRFRVLTPRGQVVLMEEFGKAIHEHGEVGQITGVLRDITERVEAVEARQMSETRFQALIEHASDAFALFDADGTFLYASPAVARINGYPRAAFMGQKAFQVVHPDDQPVLQAQFAQLLREPGASVSTRFRLRRADGVYRWLDGRAQNCLHDPAIRAVIVNYRDITEQQEAAEALRHAYTAVEQQVRERTEELTAANQALRESEARYHRMMEAIPQPVWHCTNMAELIDCNERWCEYTGQTREEARGHGWGQVLHPDDYPRVSAYLWSLLGTDTPYHIEYRLRRADGVYRWHLARALPQRNAVGEITDWFGSAEDIDDLKQTEQALRESEAKFRTITEASSTGIFIAQDGRFVFVNAAASRVTGFTPEELLQQPFLGLVHPDDRPRMQDYARRRLAGEEAPDRYEMQFIGKDGEIRWGDLTCCVISYGGEPALMAIVVNITERKRAEARVQKLYRRVEARAAEMDATISAIADGVVIFGQDARIIRMNGTAEEMFGITPATAGPPTAERMAALRIETPDGARLPAALLPSQRALRGETVHGMVLAILRVDGRRRWFSVSAAPIPSPEGEPRGAVVTMADITSQRELQQRQEDLLHIVSHDLRIPLTVIHGHLELLEESLRTRDLADAFASNTGTIARNVQRMNVMIQDLVEMARLENHQFTLHREEVLLQDYLPDLLARMRHVLPLHRLATELPGDLAPAWADHGRLERILLNLLTNACKYSGAESPVHLHAARQGAELVITVRDEGRGIAPHDLPHVFERFYRASGERQAEGIGLGLYITRLLVDAHAMPAADGVAQVGGRLWVASEPGHGSTFSFTLPVAPPAE